MTIPTEPIGSLPRPIALIEAFAAYEAGSLPRADLDREIEAAVKDTIERLEETGSPVISDGEQGKFHNFITYCVHGSANVAGEGFGLAFKAGHVRRLPRICSGPFRYELYADTYMERAQRYANRPLKQAVISCSALSLLYPPDPLAAYSREDYIDDLLREQEGEIRRCFARGAHTVQIDFTEGRLAVKLDPTGQLLNDFIELNNLVLERFSPAERARIGVHACPGGDRDSTHSADVDYAELLPSLFELDAGRFFLQLVSEADHRRVLQLMARYSKPWQQIYVGVVDPIDPHIETAEEVRDRVLEAAEFLPVERLGTTDDCGFAPFSDDISTSRDKAFAKIRARVEGTRLASVELGV
jgi:5-methyltetrahydropteroyltriglutamate--homocysteine methyltransferase